MDFWLGGTPKAGGTLIWTSPGPVIVGAAIVAALAFALALWTAREIPARNRRIEAVLWGLTLVGLTVALAGPVWVEEEGRTEPGRLVALLDTSASMAVLEGGTPRGASVAGLLDRLHPDEVYTFDEEMRVGAPDLDRPELAFQGRGTDLGVALRALTDRAAGQKLRGVILLTDGLDRGALRREWRQNGTFSLPELPGPLTIYQVGTGEDLSDTAIDDVASGGFAFLRTPFQLTASLRGAPGATNSAARSSPEYTPWASNTVSANAP